MSVENRTRKKEEYEAKEDSEEGHYQRYSYRVLQKIQMKLILLYVWSEPAILGSSKTALKFKYEI